MGIKISACVITKNEEKNIENWLNHMLPLADEIVVIDTGSTDKTVEIVKNKGITPYYFQWCNDFATAKNYAIEKATGDWIMFLDADEYFSSDSEKKLRRLIEEIDKKKNSVCILCQCVNIDLDNNKNIINTARIVRIFRNAPYIRYHGKIHEQIECEKKESVSYTINSLKIYHTGYSSSIMLEKAKRNLEFILKRREEEGDTPKICFFLMDSYYGINKYDEAIKYAKLCIASQVEGIGMAGHVYQVLIGAMINEKYPTDEVLSVIKEAQKKYPWAPSFILYEVNILWSDGDYLGVECQLKKAIRLRRRLEADLSSGKDVTDDSIRYMPRAYFLAGEIARKKGNMSQAAQYYLEGIKFHPYSANLLTGLCKCLKGADPVEMVELISQYYDREKDGEFVASAIFSYVDPKVYNYFLKNFKSKDRETEEKLNLYRYLSVHSYDKAAMEVAFSLERNYRIGVASAISEEERQDPALHVLLPNSYKKILDGTSTEWREKEYSIERLLYAMREE